MRKTYPNILELEGEKFQDPNPMTGKLGTKVPAAWLQEVEDNIRSFVLEFVALLEEADIEPDNADDNQIKSAILTLIATREISYNELLDAPKILNKLGYSTKDGISQNVANLLNEDVVIAKKMAEMSNDKSNQALFGLEKKIDKTDLKQSVGDSEFDVMSQSGVTKVLGLVSVTRFESLVEAINYCSSNNASLYFPEGEYDVNNIDFKGITINGDNSVFSGKPMNTGVIKGGISIGGYEPSSPIVHGVLPESTDSGSLIVKYRSKDEDQLDTYYVMSKNPRAGDYVSIRFGYGVGVGNAPFDLLREQTVFSVYDCLAYTDVRDFEYSGLWSDFSFTPLAIGAPAGTTSSAENAFVRGKMSSGVGDSVQFNIKVSKDGYINMMFLGSPQARTADIFINGSLYRTISFQRTVNQFITLPVFTGFGEHEVKIVNKTSGGVIYLAAVNAYRPGEADKCVDVSFDSWAHYIRNSENRYVNNSGASDYAISDADLGRFVGSYHGEESGSSYELYAGIDPISFEKGIPAIIRGFNAHQKTRIANKIDVTSIHNFFDAGVSKVISMTGEMNTKTVFLGMCLPSMDFNEIVFPKNIDVSAEDERFALGNTDTVIWRNPKNNRMVYAYHTCFTGYNNMRGGAFIKSSTGATAYAKLYHGMNIDAENIFKEASFQITHMYR